jgi:hypothetical protein
MLESKSADLTKVRVKIFISVISVGYVVFALSLDGTLLLFDKERKPFRSVSSKLDRAYTMTLASFKTGDMFLLCGGIDGQVKAVNAKSMEVVTSINFPKPPPLG